VCGLTGLAAIPVAFALIRRRPRTAAAIVTAPPRVLAEASASSSA
jgi:hypothetical protein